jgi:hypothetical protein
MLPHLALMNGCHSRHVNAYDQINPIENSFDRRKADRIGTSIQDGEYDGGTEAGDASGPDGRREGVSRWTRSCPTTS